MSATTDQSAHVVAVEKIFTRVLVGVDGSAGSIDLARQAAMLKAPGGSLTYLGAWDLHSPIVTPGTVAVPFDADERAARCSVEDAVQAAKEQLPSAQTKIVHAVPADALLDEIANEDTSLVVVGARDRSRTTGVVLGSTPTRLLHDAPCSVLLIRQGCGLPPRRIVVGVDGSPQSGAAYTAARYLAERFDGEVTVVIAEGGTAIDLGAVSLIAGDGFHVTPGEAVSVLSAASRDADLLVLGSRGLHGLKALGSVSERVAHRAECSTLIVRD
jgi:nucleotide-binding universal stress UspA family protein